MSDDRDDEDRAAILQRRQRFVAIALAGMTAGCDNLNPFAPCLEPMPIEAPVDPEQAVEMRPLPQEPMQPSMNVAMDPPPPEPPPEEPVMEEPTAMRPRTPMVPVPAPCLTPRACLSVAPQVCLSDIQLEGVEYE
jgi:hypothetical protein